jgi:hypothetical protein
MISFSGMDEGEMNGSRLGLLWIAFGEGNDRGMKGRWLQPPTVVQEPPRQHRSPELEDNDLRHGLTMPGDLAGHLSGLPRICGILCRFRADLGSKPFHEIMIDDEY